MQPGRSSEGGKMRRVNVGDSSRPASHRAWWVVDFCRAGFVHFYPAVKSFALAWPTTKDIFAPLCPLQPNQDQWRVLDAPPPPFPSDYQEVASAQLPCSVQEFYSRFICGESPFMRNQHIEVRGYLIMCPTTLLACFTSKLNALTMTSAWLQGDGLHANPTCCLAWYSPLPTPTNSNSLAAPVHHSTAIAVLIGSCSAEEHTQTLMNLKLNGPKEHRTTFSFFTYRLRSSTTSCTEGGAWCQRIPVCTSTRTWVWRRGSIAATQDPLRVRVCPFW